MPYFLFIVGLFLLFYGGYLLKKENIVRKEEFQELLNIQNTDNQEYIKLIAANQDLKARLDSIDNKLDHFLGQLELMNKDQPNSFDHSTITVSDYPTESGSDYHDAVEKAKEKAAEELEEAVEQANEEKSEEQETGASSNLGKGEVRFIQNLLEK